MVGLLFFIYLAHILKTFTEFVFKFKINKFLLLALAVSLFETVYLSIYPETKGVFFNEKGIAANVSAILMFLYCGINKKISAVVTSLFVFVITISGSVRTLLFIFLAIFLYLQKSKKSIIMLSFICGLLIILIFNKQFLNRFNAFIDAKVFTEESCGNKNLILPTGRYAAFSLFLLSEKSSLLFGNGFGTYHKLYQEKFSKGLTDEIDYSGFNILELLVEVGVFGLLIYCVLILAAFYITNKRMNKLCYVIYPLILSLLTAPTDITVFYQIISLCVLNKKIENLK